MLLHVVLLSLGLLLLFFGSEWLVSGSASIAVAYAIKPIIIGLTIVAFGTSSPEFLVSLFASQTGENGISIGNILGSNVINIALVLGASILVKPIAINKGNVNREVLFMLGASMAFWLVCMDGVIGFADGVMLLSMLALFLIYGISNAKEDVSFEDIIEKPKDSLGKSSLMIIISIVFLCAGAHLVVDHSVSIAEFFNVSKTFIGISIVALGTSLPELVTSIMAAKKEESDIALGNVVGSNMFNICMVMGMVGIINPMIVETDLNGFEFPFMIFVSLILTVFLFRGKTLGRRHGVFLIGCFVVYILGSYYSVS
ncbi:MAG: calcium/sodium antiporter [Proteobacteria bacterium]|nr:calcium/sodium antiporter [Pseudomonadota bacterium]